MQCLNSGSQQFDYIPRLFYFLKILNTFHRTILLHHLLPCIQNYTTHLCNSPLAWLATFKTWFCYFERRNTVTSSVLNYCLYDSPELTQSVAQVYLTMVPFYWLHIIYAKFRTKLGNSLFSQINNMFIS